MEIPKKSIVEKRNAARNSRKENVAKNVREEKKWRSCGFGSEELEVCHSETINLKN